MRNAIPEFGKNAGKVFSVKLSNGRFRLVSNGTTGRIVPGQEQNEFAREKINLSVNELKSERDVVRDLLPS